jgi:hypothetical protein
MCITRPRVVPAVGGAVVAICCDRMFPSLPKEVHHAIGALVAEATLGQGVPMILSMSGFDQVAALDVACTVSSGMLSGYVIGIPKVRAMLPI